MNENEVSVNTVADDFDISDFLTDPKLEIEGVWFGLGKGREIKLARSKNETSQSLIRAKYKANRVILEQDDDVSAKLNQDLMIEVYAHTIIKGLRVNGKDVSYTPSKGIEMLQSQDFRDKIFAFAATQESYKAKAEDSAVKS